MPAPSSVSPAPPATPAVPATDAGTAGGDATRSPSLSVLGLVTLLALLWGGNSVFIKIGLRDLPPLALSSARFALALGAIGSWVALRRVGLRIQAGQLVPLLALSQLFLAQVALLTLGTKLTFAAHSTVMMGAFPFFTALFAHWMIPGDRLVWRTGAGMVAAVAGIVVTFAAELLASGVSARTVAGDLVVLTSSMLLGLRTVVSKRMLSGMTAEKLLFWMILFSLPGSLALSALFERHQPWSLTPVGLVAILYVGVVVAGFCFTAWTSVLRRYRASRLTVLFFATPVFGVFLSWALLGDRVGPSLLAGTALVAVGIYLVNSGRSRAQ